VIEVPSTLSKCIDGVVAHQWWLGLVSSLVGIHTYIYNIVLLTLTYWDLNSLCLSCKNSLIASLIAGSMNSNLTSSFLTEWNNPSYLLASSIVSSNRSFDWNSNMIPFNQLWLRREVGMTYIHRSWVYSSLCPIDGVDRWLLDVAMAEGIGTFVDVRDLISNLWSILSAVAHELGQVSWPDLQRSLSP